MKINYRTLTEFNYNKRKFKNVNNEKDIKSNIKLYTFLIILALNLIAFILRIVALNF